MTKYNEQKLASYNDKYNRLILLLVTDQWGKIKYQVKLNRKVQGTNVFEYPMRKLFASICQNITLQLKIY